MKATILLSALACAALAAARGGDSAEPGTAADLIVINGAVYPGLGGRGSSPRLCHTTWT